MMALATAVARPSARRSKGAGWRFIRVAIECCGEWSMSSLEHVVGVTCKNYALRARREGRATRRANRATWTLWSARERSWDLPGAWG